MEAILKSMTAGLAALLLTASAAVAQDRAAFGQEELDQMLAPVALYPDPLLSQILMASTYPLEVVQAARWSRSNAHLKGEDAVRTVDAMDWDPSVKSLVAFPQVLQRMDEQLEWTQRLGEAFLAQEPQVMETIQALRARAAAAGHLESSPQTRVTRQDGYIFVEPADSHVVYVPYYDPAVVYGPWWWPAYPPVYWAPFPGYYVSPAHPAGFLWSGGIVISTALFFGHFDWHHRHVKVVHVHHHHRQVDRRIVVRHHGAAPDRKPTRWQHDPHHRKGVPFRHTVLRRQFGSHPAVRGDDRSRPITPHAPRAAHPQPGNAAPQTHALPAASNSRPERFTPHASDRWAERNARADVQHPRPRAPETRPTTATPHSAPQLRRDAPPPVMRAEPRPNPPAANQRAAARQQAEPGRRAEPHHPARPSAHPRRPATRTPIPVPRLDSGHARTTARSPGGGQPRASSPGNGRRF